MTISDTHIALVASPHLEWRPGMLTLPEPSTGRTFRASLGMRGEVVFARESGPGGYGWGCSLGWAGAAFGNYFEAHALGECGCSQLPTATAEHRVGAGAFVHAFPDIDDHATQGCMLALVRKAWGLCMVEVVLYEDGAANVEVWKANALIYSMSADSLGLALAAALLAAPAPTEGP